MDDIATAVKSVAASGILAGDRSIQAHHQKIAARKLDAWDEMVFVSIGRSQTSSALRGIGQNAVSLLRWYSKAKVSIAKTSQWFERVPEHPSYLVAGGSELSMALRGGAWIHPKMEADQLWLEKRVSEIIQRVVVALVKKGSDRSCAEVLESFNGWIAGSAHQFRVLEMEIGLQTATQIGQVVGGASTETGEATDRDRLHGLGVADGLARAIPNAAGHLNQRLGTLDLDQLLDRASKAAIRTSGPLGGFPPGLRANVESFRAKHSVERDVEGSIRTPSWFARHHAARLLSVDIRTTFESLLSRTEQWLPSQAKSLREEGEAGAAVMVIQRGLESVSKLEAGADYTNSRLEELRRRRVKTAGEQWPDVSPEQWRERLRALRLKLINELAELTPLLSTTPPTGGLPDSFGFAYTTLCDAMIEALADMDVTTFDLLYPVLVPSAFKAHDRVKTELAESSAENSVYFATDVVLDVMEISGYAYLWKFALGEEPFWNSVTRVWDDLLPRQRNPIHLIRLVVLGDNLHRERPVISPRSLIRSAWQDRLRQLLKDKGFAPQGLISNGLPRMIAIDPTAASYMRDWRTRNARDLMLSEYILSRPEAEGVHLPRGVEDLREGAKRVSGNRASGRVEGGHKSPGGIW